MSSENNSKREVIELQHVYADLYALAAVKNIIDHDTIAYPYGMPGLDFSNDHDLVIRNVQWIAIRQQCQIPQFPDRHGFEVAQVEFEYLLPLLDLKGGTLALLDRFFGQVDRIKTSFLQNAMRVYGRELVDLFFAMQEKFVRSYENGNYIEEEEDDDDSLYSLANVLDSDDAVMMPFAEDARNVSVDLLPLSQIMERMMCPVIPTGKEAKEAFGKGEIAALYDPRGGKEDAYFAKNPVYITFLCHLQEKLAADGPQTSLYELQALLEQSWKEMQTDTMPRVYHDALGYHIRMQFPLLICLITKEGFGIYQNAAHVVLSL